MYEIVINLSWFPAWMMWTAGGAVYISIGVVLSCLFRAREAIQAQLYENGCGLECCPGHKCGDNKSAYDSNRHMHHCNGDNLTTDHKLSWEACQIARCGSIPLWPAVLVVGVLWKLACVVKDLWCHSARYALKNRQIRG